MRFFFFFFQAEDGIRDYKVTGVQTCALPIWIGHVGLAAGQRELERRAQALFFNWIRRGEIDPYRSTTSLGDVGEIKLHDRVVMRLDPGARVHVPMLLRQASYNLY